MAPVDGKARRDDPEAAKVRRPVAAAFSPRTRRSIRTSHEMPYCEDGRRPYGGAYRHSGYYSTGRGD
jgi:hypothetical protein